MNWKILVVVAVIAALLLLKNPASAATLKGDKSYLGSDATRGIKNNNPLNIRRSSEPWKGKVSHSKSTDKEFEQFVSWYYGIRAGIKNIKTWYGRGKNTLHELINTWAPTGDGDNNPSAYADFVASRSGIGVHSPFLWEKAVVSKIVRAMAEMECGKDVVTEDDFNRAWSMV